MTATAPAPETPQAPDDGWTEARDTGWVGGPVHLKPSLLAALDVTVKVLGTVAAFLVPFSVAAAVQGEPLLGGAAFLGAEALSFYPALLAAFFPAVQLAFTRYTLDAEGVVVHVQILNKSTKKVPWEKVTALHHRRSLVDSLLRIERLDVVAYGEKGATLHLVGLRNAAVVRDRVARCMRSTASVDALFRGD